mgnify:CR=1 FL=1
MILLKLLVIVVMNIDETKFEYVYFLNIPTTEYSQCLDHGDNGQRFQTNNTGITIIFPPNDKILGIQDCQ